MNASEWRATAGLAGLYGIRMFGIFMVLPVLALYARGLPGADGFHVGLALGAYGLTQALLQLPYGMASDRLGRKPMIALGLFVFIAGSLLAAFSTGINGMILGRALQGAGAVGAVSNALLADLTRPEQRTKAMLVLGIGIGASFSLALILGPVLGHLLGVPGLFMLAAVMALLSLGVLFWFVPAAPAPAADNHVDMLAQMRRVLAAPQLLRLDASIFLLHAGLTALFIAVPMVLQDRVGLAETHHWLVYLPVMLGSLLLTLPLMYLAERKGHLKAIFVGAIALLGLSNVALIWVQTSLAGIVVCLFLFFGAFNLLEATLPSLVSRVCATELRGAGMGVYSSCQFLGAFFGGALGGLAQQYFGPAGLFASAAILCACWLLVAAGVQPPLAQAAAGSAD